MLSTSSIPELLQTLKTSDFDRQQSAAIALVERGSEAFDLLATELIPYSHHAPIVAWILGVMGDMKAVPILMEKFNSRDELLSIAIAKALGELGEASPQVCSALLECAQNSQDELRRACLTSLGWLGSAESVPAILPMLEDKDPETRLVVAETLAKLGNTQAVEPLIDHLQDDNVWVRQRAAYALGKLRAPRACRALIECLIDHNEWVRQSAALALGELGEKEAKYALISTLKDDTSPVVRRAVAYALGIVGGEDAVEVLTAALADSDEGVVEAADSALNRLGYSIDDDELD